MNPNIAEWVFRSVADWPNWSAFVSSRGDRLVTFRQFGELIDRIAACLTELGIRVNTRTAVMVPPGVEFAAVTMALFHVGRGAGPD